MGTRVEGATGWHSLGTVAVVNSGYSRILSIMHLLRCLFLI